MLRLCQPMVDIAEGAGVFEGVPEEGLLVRAKPELKESWGIPFARLF